MAIIFLWRGFVIQIKYDTLVTGPGRLCGILLLAYRTPSVEERLNTSKELFHGDKEVIMDFVILTV